MSAWLPPRVGLPGPAIYTAVQPSNRKAVTRLARICALGAAVCVVAGGRSSPARRNSLLLPHFALQSKPFRSPLSSLTRTAPVTGLTQDDFEILEDGLAQPVTTFSAVDVPIERTERAIGEPDVVGNDGPPGRLYLIALDDMSAENALRTRFFLRQFIEKHFGPNDSAAVVLTTRVWARAGRNSRATGGCCWTGSTSSVAVPRTTSRRSGSRTSSAACWL